MNIFADPRPGKDRASVAGHGHQSGSLVDASELPSVGEVVKGTGEGVGEVGETASRFPALADHGSNSLVSHRDIAKVAVAAVVVVVVVVVVPTPKYC